MRFLMALMGLVWTWVVRPTCHYPDAVEHLERCYIKPAVMGRDNHARP
jgi:hypothetical protein